MGTESSSHVAGLEDDAQPRGEQIVRGARGAVGPAVAVVGLQRSVGNRAVSALVARRQTPEARALMRSPTKQTRQRARPVLKVTVVPGRKMGGDEFAILVLQQVYGYSPEEAKARLEAFDRNGGKRRGKHLNVGVTEAEARTPVEVEVDLAPADPTEDPDAELRAADLAALEKEDRKAINDEVDRRFWAKVGDRRHGSLGLGSSDEAKRELWMRTRDEVLKDRDRTLSTPIEYQELVTPGGGEIRPEDYGVAIRIADKTKNFTPADWERYQRNVTASTDDLEVVEQSIDRFAGELSAEHAVLDRLKGTEGFYVAWHDPWSGEGLKRQRLKPPAAFKDFEDYDAACAEYLRLFRDRAGEITFLTLRASEAVVRSELARYQKQDEIAALYGDLAGMRNIVDKYAGELRQNEEDSEDPDSKRSDIDVDQAEKDIMSMLQADTEAERQRLAPKHAIFTDEELKTETLTKRDPDQLAAALRSDAEDRLHDIDKTRARLVNDPDVIFQFDRIIELTKQELGATKGTIGDLIIERKLHETHVKDVIRAIATVVLAIGLGILTFGTGTVAVLAGTALLGLGVYQGVEDVKQYGDAFAAAHTAFDSNQAVSSNSPSAFWAAFSLISAGLDGAQLIDALKAAGPALHELDETGQFLRFKAMLETSSLAPELQQTLLRAIKAKNSLEQAARSLKASWTRALGAGSVLGSGVGNQFARVLAEVTQCAYYAAMLGMKKLEQFVAYAKVGRLGGIDLRRVTREQLQEIEDAWTRGVQRAEHAGVATDKVDPRFDPPDTPAGTPAQPGSPTTTPPATGHAPPVHPPAGAARPPRITGSLIDADRRTAGTGGIVSIEGRINAADGTRSVIIEGELRPPLVRATAPNYNDEAVWATLRDLYPDTAGYQAAHLWGPGFGDEAAAGMMLAPAEVNLVWQNGWAEKWLREDLQEAAAQVSQHIGHPVTIRVRAVATSHPADVAGGAVLHHVEYTFSAEARGTHVTLGKIELSVDAPPRGTVHEVRPQRFSGGI
jgi:Bacterial toxin 4